MNRFTFLAATAAVGALGFLGCDDDRPDVPHTMPPNAADMYKNTTHPSGPATTQDVGDALDDAADDAADAATDAGNAVKDAAKDAAEAAGDAAEEAGDAAEDAGDAAKDAADDATK